MAVDGPAGAGKTTFAARLGASLGAQVVGSDEFPVPWEGGPGGWFGALREQVIVPLSQGRPGGFARYDWVLGEFAEHVEVPVAPVVLIEGVGTARRDVDRLLSFRIWLDAPHDLRRERVLRRDGAGLEERWTAWFAAEREWFAADGTRERADLVIA